MGIFRFNLLLIMLVATGCETKETYTFVLSKNAKRQLAGDSEKTWILARRFNNKTRMNMGDCFLSYAQTFKADGMMNDNAGENQGCGETLEAKWNFAKTKDEIYYLKLEGEKLGELMNIDSNFKHFKILQLSDSSMTLQFFHKQFSNKSTQITDFWVPIGTKVNDRNFHW